MVHRIGGRDEASHPLPDSCFLVFLFAKSSREVLSALGSRWTEGLTAYATHGLASVVAVVREPFSVEELIAMLDGTLNAAEIWPVEGGAVVEANVVVQDFFDGEDAPFGDPIQASSLPYEVRTEVEQFNLNVRYFWARASQYCPEFSDLAGWLHQSVADTAQDIHAYAQADTDPASLPDPQQHYGRVSLLVEINACLTMLNSQLVAVTPPLTKSTFPVGEYSLLGIGSAVRATWRLYSHMSDVFAQAQHLDKVHAMSNGAPFDPGTKPYSLNPETWADSPLSIEEQDPAVEVAEPRRHIVYFSSRWGFHQTVQSVSVSWQCLNGNAAREWNLLTLSHEFLHSHLREMLDELLLVGSAEDLVKLVEVFNSDAPRTFGEATKQFLLQRLRWIEHGRQLSRAADAADASRIDPGAQRVDILQAHPMTTDEAAFLLNDRLRFLEEVVVHVMDFIYFYDAADDLFVSSLWHSWALIPNVQPKVEDYVLRTLLALSSTWMTDDASAAFDDATGRLDDEFSAILGDGSHGLIEQAQAVLHSKSGGASSYGLRTRFICSYPLVRWARRFLVSGQLHAVLSHDDQRAIGPRAYALDPWDFPDVTIQSPSGFLLDRYRTMVRAHENEGLEGDSLWQLLVLT
jgi:hypothetical protein